MVTHLKNSASPESLTNKAQHANPGKLDAETELGIVHLNIADLGRSLDFYQRVIGLEALEEGKDTALLGAGELAILALTEMPGAKKYLRRSGLYHFAILTPSRQALGRSLQNLIDSGSEIQGGADHLVSEAIYLADPDGNGIEIYRDRPRTEWPYENGRLKMATDPLDFQGVLNAADGDWAGLESGTRLGHVHLHVADLDAATRFYEQLLGFDFLLNYMGSAAFLSAGGYHHHIGINTWNGVGAAANPQDAVGLRYFTVNLVNEEQLQGVIERLEAAAWPFETRNSGIFVKDSSQNGVLLEVSPAR